MQIHPINGLLLTLCLFSIHSVVNDPTDPHDARDPLCVICALNQASSDIYRFVWESPPPRAPLPVYILPEYSHTPPTLTEEVLASIYDVLWTEPVMFVGDLAAEIAGATRDMLEAAEGAAMAAYARVIRDLQGAHTWLVEEEEFQRWRDAEAMLSDVAWSHTRTNGGRLNSLVRERELAQHARGAWNEKLHAYVAGILNGVEDSIADVFGAWHASESYVRACLGALKPWISAVMVRSGVFAYDHIPLFQMLLPTWMEMYFPYAPPRLALALVDFVFTVHTLLLTFHDVEPESQ